MKKKIKYLPNNEMLKNLKLIKRPMKTKKIIMKKGQAL